MPLISFGFNICLQTYNIPIFFWIKLIIKNFSLFLFFELDRNFICSIIILKVDPCIIIKYIICFSTLLIEVLYFLYLKHLTYLSLLSFSAKELDSNLSTSEDILGYIPKHHTFFPFPWPNNSCSWENISVHGLKILLLLPAIFPWFCCYIYIFKKAPLYFSVLHFSI